jgi:hypothetical protein
MDAVTVVFYVTDDVSVVAAATEVISTLTVNGRKVVSVVGGTPIAGNRGTQILVGSGDPSPELGIPGDFYFDALEQLLYGPKTLDGWPESPSLEMRGVVDRHVHIQSFPSSAWSISHSLGGRPSVLVFDEDDSRVFVEISHPAEGQVLIESETPFSGSAYLT